MTKFVIHPVKCINAICTVTTLNQEGYLELLDLGLGGEFSVGSARRQCLEDVVRVIDHHDHHEPHAIRVLGNGGNYTLLRRGRITKVW